MCYSFFLVESIRVVNATIDYSPVLRNRITTVHASSIKLVIVAVSFILIAQSIAMILQNGKSVGEWLFDCGDRYSLYSP